MHHEHGGCAIEWAGSECCRAAHECEEPPADGGREPATTVSDTAEPCSDTPYRPEQVLAARTSNVRCDRAHEVRAAPAAILVWDAPATFAFERTPARGSRGPPREAVPRRAQHFVLRC